MDALTIERVAINAVEAKINASKFLASYLDSNDKTPSWDGSIFIFSNEQKKKDHFIGRLPVQVKGHEEDNLSKEEISYSVDIADLRNYLKDGGVMFFVVYMTLNADETDYNKKIYVAELIPAVIESLISECPIIQQTTTIRLKPIPQKPEDFASIVWNCYENCKRQKSFVETKLPTLDELADKGVLEGIQFFVSGYGDNRGIQGFLKMNTPLYALIKGSTIPQPLKHQGDVVYKIASQIVQHKVSVNGQIFYTQYKVVYKLEESVIQIGHSFTITFRNNSQGGNVNYKTTHMLRQFVEDAPFMIAFAKARRFMIDNVPFDFTEVEFDTSNYNLEDHIKQYEFLKRYVETFERQGCSEDLDYTKLKETDWHNLERLAQATIDNKTIDGPFDSLTPVIALTVGPLQFAVSLIPVDGEDGKYRMHHIQDETHPIIFVPDNGDHIPVPICRILKPEDYIRLVNIKYDQILPDIKTYLLDEHISASANAIMLNMISAADIAEGEKKLNLLKYAAEINDWLTTLDEKLWDRKIAALNGLQIIARQRQFGEKERAVLYGIIATSSEREDIIFAANALLGNVEEAMKHFAALPDSAQEEMKQYPIYHFVSEVNK